MILKNVKDVSWAGAKTMMTDPSFLKSLLEFDKDGLTEKQVKKVRTEYMKDPNFTHDNLKNVSSAGAGKTQHVNKLTASHTDMCCLVSGWHWYFWMLLLTATASRNARL